MDKKCLRSITWSQGHLEILDQLLLPFDSKYISITDTAKGWEAIHKMQVRGAPAIAVVGCLSLAAELLELDSNKFNRAELHNIIKQKLSYLESARPTAVNMQNASKELCNFSENLLEDKCSVDEFKEKIINWCVSMYQQDIATNKKLAELGAEAILANMKSDTKPRVLTHCNTGSLATAGYGTALGVIRKLFELNKLGHVYCTETRPYNQGARLTAYELVYENIDSTLICDDMAAALMHNIGIDAVIVGADRVAANGDTANKIGTYQLAIISKYHRVPFYVCSPTSSVDLSLSSGSEIPIEVRPPEELTSLAGVRIAAPGIACWNPSFDVTPAELITGGIITEKGVFSPRELAFKLTNVVS